MSLSLPVSINPKPLLVSRLMVPSGICPIPQKSVLQRCPKTLCSGCSTANGPFYRVDWLPSTGGRRWDVPERESGAQAGSRSSTRACNASIRAQLVGCGGPQSLVAREWTGSRHVARIFGGPSGPRWPSRNCRNSTHHKPSRAWQVRLRHCPRDTPQMERWRPLDCPVGAGDGGREFPIFFSKCHLRGLDSQKLPW